MKFDLNFMKEDRNRMYKLRWAEDDKVEVGLDEAGRGCLFGRLYAAAVVLPNEIDTFFDHGAGLKAIRDSKKLSERKRAILFDYIDEIAIETSVSYAEVEEIDRINILQADMAAMHRALDTLTVPIQRILVDGDCWKPWKGVEAHKIIEGDASYLAIAAAGILAKVSRDRWVEEQMVAHPEWETHYGFASNKGYGTEKHITGIQTHGVTAQHRTSFTPVRKVLRLPIKSKSSTSPSGWLGED
jgi:ribonuclease HII